MTPEALAEIEARAKAATPGPWYWNGYSVVFSTPLMERMRNGDAPEYPATRRPGPPWFSPEDNAWLKQQHEAYEADSTVCSVPAEYGDTATGHHAWTAEFIERAITDVPALLRHIRAQDERIKALEVVAEAVERLVLRFHPVFDSAEWYAERKSVRVLRAALSRLRGGG